MKKHTKMENPSIFEKKFDEWAVEKEDFSETFIKQKQELVRISKNLLVADIDTPDSSEYRKRWIFKNEFGIAVIRGYGTFGAKKGLFECAVIDKNKRLRYDTEITNDVIGWLTSKEVLKLGRKIKNLKTERRQKRK